MSDELLVHNNTITVDDIHNALNLVVYNDPQHIEQQEPVCAWPNLCGKAFCRFPRYLRGTKPNGLVAHVLIQLGYPIDLLKALDFEYEMGEVIHPGVKIHRSRNKALKRIDARGISLFAFLQSHQKSGHTWAQISVEAFRPRRMVPFLDVRRRPWLY